MALVPMDHALSHETRLLLLVGLAVVGLVVAVSRFKLNSFLALVLAALLVGLGAGLPPVDIVTSFQAGLGGVLGSIALIIALGTVLGKLLAESGGAQVIAQRLIQVAGTRRIHWAMAGIGLLVGLPVWFSVGVVLLVPIVFTLARETRTPLLFVALPMVTGLSVAHGLVPPHPGPLAAIGLLGADTGKTILYALLVGLPTTLLSGPLLAPLFTRYVKLAGEPAAQSGQPATDGRPHPPGFGLTVFTILLPILLMLGATLGDVLLAKDDAVRPWLAFAGSPLVAMVAGVLFAGWSFGFARGFDRGQVLKFSEECLAPTALVLLVVGCGGGFSKVLVATGVDQAITAQLKDHALSPLVLGWLMAALIRVATGSATVAITTAAGLLAPVAARTPGTNLELLVVAMGAGSLILSHLNDGGFWFVKEYLQLSVAETLKTWTVIETVIAVLGLVFTLLLDLWL